MVWVILLVFALTGFTVMYLKKFVKPYLGEDWWVDMVYYVLILPFYNLLNHYTIVPDYLNKLLHGMGLHLGAILEKMNIFILQSSGMILNFVIILVPFRF